MPRCRQRWSCRSTRSSCPWTRPSSRTRRHGSTSAGARSRRTSSAGGGRDRGDRGGGRGRRDRDRSRQWRATSTSGPIGWRSRSTPRAIVIPPAGTPPGGEVTVEESHMTVTAVAFPRAARAPRRLVRLRRTRRCSMGSTCQRRPGAAVGLIGPNGCGKTTTLHLALWLAQAGAGLHQRARAPAAGSARGDQCAAGVRARLAERFRAPHAPGVLPLVAAVHRRRRGLSRAAATS